MSFPRGLVRAWQRPGRVLLPAGPFGVDGGGRILGPTHAPKLPIAIKGLR